MPDPGRLPDIDRVDAGRRRPLLVALTSVIVIGLLVWRPWGESVSPATLSPTAVAPTPGATTARTSDPAAIDVGSIVNLASTIVRCEYVPREGGGWQLSSLVVVPPRLEPQPDVAEARVLEVSWRAEVQRNELDSIFSASWEQVALSDPQFAPAISSPFLAFGPTHLDYEDASSSASSVLRVVIQLEWFGPHRAMLGSGSFVVQRYDRTFDQGESRPPRIEGCHAVTVS